MSKSWQIFFIVHIFAGIYSICNVYTILIAITSRQSRKDSVPGTRCSLREVCGML